MAALERELAGRRLEDEQRYFQENRQVYEDLFRRLYAYYQDAVQIDDWEERVRVTNCAIGPALTVERTEDGKFGPRPFSRWRSRSSNTTARRSCST